MNLDNMIDSAIGDIRKDRESVYSSVKANEDYVIDKGGKKLKSTVNLDKLHTSNIICNTIAALGYLDMNETKRIARIVHNKVLLYDINRSKILYKDRISRVFNSFMRSKYGNRVCLGAFSYYYVTYKGTKISLKDLLHVDSVSCSRSLSSILTVLNNINSKHIKVDTLGIQLSDVYGNSIELKKIIEDGRWLL